MQIVQGEEHVKQVQLWLTTALAEPSALGGMHVEEIAYRMIGTCTGEELIEKFKSQRDARRAIENPLIVPE